MIQGSRKAKLFLIALVVSILIFGMMLFLMDKAQWIELYGKFNQSIQWLFGLFVGGNGVEHISKRNSK